ncbi:unnamed protein product [Miscanthus lutarioriparius]|uniref:TF-B3 domain-containing protein n=1 Tax=Miscanthus lutarioriparius TaxID=422564 RepID=A0A811R9F0_9POAL|nr:unnamed protein product [Miscanthus lutarioriparius]
MASNGVGGGGGPHKFFKVLLPGSFEISLSLPPKFAASLGVSCPWRAASKLRDRTGRSWDVDLHRDAAHRVSFTGGGWRGFVSANAVSAGQLLVFEHRGVFDFTVDRFDASGCCCDDNGGHEDGGGRGPNKVVDQHMTTTGTEAAADKESGNSRRRPEAAPCTGGVKRRRWSPSTATTVVSGGDDNETLCRRIERPYQLRLLDLSKSFCDRVGWTSSCDVVLCAAGDGDGGSKEEEKRWQVSVKVSAKNAMMCGGWTEFAKDNGLAVSDACIFVPLPASPGSGSDVLQVHLLRGNRSRGTSV